MDVAPSVALGGAVRVQRRQVLIGTLLIAKLHDHLEDLAARGEHPSARAFVVVQSVHELDLGRRIVPLASGGIDLPAAADFDAALELSTLGNDGGVLLAALRFFAPIAVASVLFRL